MSREKQIEEMTKAIDQAKHDMWVGNAHQSGDFTNHSKNIATALYNAGYHKQPEWISVEDRLPNLDPYGKGRYGGQRSVRVLCACKQRDGRTFVKEGYYEPCSNGKVVWRIPGSIDSVTHWMPLPEPPKKGGAE